MRIASGMRICTYFALFLCIHRVTGQYDIVSAVAGTIPSSENVQLDCQFANQWTSARHPLAYPRQNAHWSPPIVASHSQDYSMWAKGELASAAMQVVAETGVKLTLLEELESSTDVLDQQSGRAMYNTQQQSQSLPAILVDADHPYISTTTKISPSPDWITGFYGVNILDSSSNTWLASIEIDTFPWDAGTDSGPSYRSENDPTDPQRVIARIDVDSESAQSRGMPLEGIFLSPGGDSVLPVARWTCSITAVSTTPTATTDDPPGPTATGSAEPVSTSEPSASASLPPPPVSPQPTAVPTVTPTPGPTVSPTVAPTSSDNNPTVASTFPPTSRPTANVIPFTVVESVPGSIPSADAIGMSCMITNEWTASRHPNDYPTDTASWSPMVVASHSADFQMWENGQIASAGVRSIAMSGKPNLMVGELMIADEGVLDYHKGSAIKNSVRQNETIFPVRLDIDHSFMSTIASLVPSPDWFSGYYAVNMIDPATERWYDKVVIDTFPWDAGTDSGTTYKADPSPLAPSYLITQLTVGTVPDSGVFLSPDGSTVYPVSRWTCTRVPAPAPKATSGVFVQSLLVSGLLFLATAVSLL